MKFDGQEMTPDGAEIDFVLLENTEHSGTVVRWSAAKALSIIIQHKTILNKELLPVIEAIEKREEYNSIKKIYQEALKRST